MVPGDERKCAFPRRRTMPSWLGSTLFAKYWLRNRRHELRCHFTLRVHGAKARVDSTRCCVESSVGASDVMIIGEWLVLELKLPLDRAGWGSCRGIVGGRYQLTSPGYLWDHLPRHKSLFYAPPGKGLPIGNLTSQFFANIYESV